MATVGVTTASIGRGRGRGRGRAILRTLQENVFPEDVLDASNGIQQLKIATLSEQERFKDAIEASKDHNGSSVKESKSLISSLSSIREEPLIEVKRPPFTENGRPSKEPLKGEGKLNGLPVRCFILVSVDCSAKTIHVEFRDNGVITSKDYKATLYASNSMQKWTQENSRMLKFIKSMDDVLLIVLEYYTAKLLPAVLFETGDCSDVPTLAIDMFSSENLRKVFLTVIIFNTLPQFPPEGKQKIGLITHVPGNGTVRVVFYDSTYLALIEDIREAQLRHGVYGPGILTAKEAIELIREFCMRNFLAPFQGDWTNLQRVKILGFETDNQVNVEYIDIGIEVTLPANELAFTLRDNLPELTEKVQGMAVNVRAYEDSVENNARFAKLGRKYEGCPCYVQLLEEDRDGELPVVEVYLPHAKGTGCIKLIDSLRASADPTVKPAENRDFKGAALKAIQVRLERTNQNWKDQLNQKREEEERIKQATRKDIVYDNKPLLLRTIV